GIRRRCRRRTRSRPDHRRLPVIGGTALLARRACRRRCQRCPGGRQPGVQEPRIDGIAIAAPSGAACWIEPADLDADGEQSLAGWWSDPARHKILHDAKGQLHAVMAHGWTPDGVVADTAIAAYLLRPDQRTYDLSDLAVRHLNQQLGNVAEDSGQLTLDDAAEATAAVERAGAVRDLWPVLDRDLAAGNAQYLLQTIEMPIMMILARMERTGIAID